MVWRWAGVQLFDLKRAAFNLLSTLLAATTTATTTMAAAALRVTGSDLQQQRALKAASKSCGFLAAFR